VVAAHGQLATALLKSAEGIVGSIPRVAAVDISDSDTRQSIEAKIEKALRRVAADGSVLFLTDIFGASAGNLARQFVSRYDLRIVAGVNLPMLLEVATHRDEENVDKLSRRVEKTGKVAVLDSARMRKTKR